MNYLDKKLYLYFINREGERELNEIDQLYKDNGRNINDYKYKVKKHLKKIRKELQKYNINDLTYTNFNNILTTYENTTLNDEDKKRFEKVVKALATIHDIDLTEQPPKEELELTEEEIFYKFCQYYINDNESVDFYNELQTIATNYNFNFYDMQTSAIDFVEKLKLPLEKQNLNISYDSFETLLSKYKKEKKQLTDSKKAEQLKILASLSKIYNINLREELTKNNQEEKVDKFEIYFLDNDEIITKLLKDRYDNGKFKIELLTLDSDITPSDKEKYNSVKAQSELTIQLINTFYSKITNYAEQDLNEFYLSLITEDDYNRLNDLTEKDIFTFIMALNNHIDQESICNKLNINNTLYNFLSFAIDTTNYYNDYIGINNKSMFKTNDEETSYIIYLNTPNSKYTTEFLNKYIIKCIDNNLNYHLKGININGNNKDRTIIYSSLDDLKEKLNIINNILINNTDISNNFGTPIHLVKPDSESLYSISNYNNSDITYIEYFNDLCEVSYYRVLSKLLLNKLTDDNELDIIKSLINLNNITINTIPSLSKYNNYEFSEIKDTINRYIPDIINTIRMYIEEDENIKEFIKEFKNSLQYIYNVNNNISKKDKINIIFSGE